MINATNVDIVCQLLDGTFWKKGKELGKNRVYLHAGYNTKKMKTTAYIDFTDILTEEQFKDKDMNFYHNANLVVFVSCPSQHTSWCAKEAERVKNSIMAKINAEIAQRKAILKQAS